MMITFFRFSSSNCSLLIDSNTFSPVSQTPSLEMPIWVTSYFSGSSADSTDRAEIRDTSCSPDRPPKRTAMRSFLSMLTTHRLVPLLVRGLRRIYLPRFFGQDRSALSYLRHGFA